MSRDRHQAAVAGDAREVRIQREERPVVVEHLLEVRDRPFGVDRVAAEAPAELIVDAAVGHAIERQSHDAQRVLVALARECAKAEIELERMRELGRGAETAVHAIERAQEFVEQSSARGVERGRAAARRLERGQRLGKPAALLGQLAAVLAKRRRHLGKYLDEPRQAVAPLLREIRAGEEGRPVGREEHRKRPSPGPPGEERMRGLVDLVEVGTLLAVDLHVDERIVHHAGDGGVLERLVRHHVAPVTRGVADRQEDRLVFRARPGEGLLAPRVPVDGIARVLLQVRAGGLRESIGHAPF